MVSTDKRAGALIMSLLRDELNAYKELLKLAERKTDVLVKGDVKVLDEITKIEQEMIAKLGRMEAERYDLVKQLAEAMHKDPSEITATFVKDVLPPQETENFTKIYQEFKDVLKKIDEKNRVNERLIKKALEYINFSIDLLTGAGEPKTGYGADGQSARQRAFHFVDRKA
ncbi:flagellar protein FlgN [Thermoanaerobacterium sp. DL9XJH110]|uniref:flagellar protein FlgN n=1 Tax=Thermoanaerobacterium sp. DL9XJH110 TaxID=3386643 RepID=UPI003BB67DE4